MSSKTAVKATSVHITGDDIVTKYKLAGDIAQKALEYAVSLVVEGAKAFDICSKVDAFIVTETSAVYPTDKVMLKGISFPTSVAVNDVVGNAAYSADAGVVLNANDVVKIDLGVTIDGYAAQVANTVVVGSSTVPAVVTAAYTAANVAARLLKSGANNEDITEAIGTVANEFNVHPVFGVLSHNITRFSCTGEKVICQVDDADRKANKITFESGEAYVLDIVFSTSDVKPVASDAKPCVYRRDVTKKIAPKTTSGKQILQQIDRNSPCFPFTARNLNAIKSAGLGLVELTKLNILESYPIMISKNGIVAQFKFTILLMPDGTSKVIGATSKQNYVAKSEKYTDVLAQPIVEL